MKIKRKLLTENEYLKIFSGVENKLYSQIKKEILQDETLSCTELESYFEILELPTGFSLEIGEVTNKMNSTNHVDLYYWEVRYFLQEAFRDTYLGYPYEAYLYRKILMLKSAFTSWLAFYDKIESIVDFKKDYLDFFEKYGKVPRGSLPNTTNYETISWLGQTKSFRKFANGIKHNHDYLSEIQIADMGHLYWTYPVHGVTTFKSGAYPHDEVSSFFYQECFQKLLVAFNDTIKILNSLPKTI